jgi:hypothetical protein
MIGLVAVVSMGDVLRDSSVSRDEDYRSRNTRTNPMATMAQKQHRHDLFLS